MKFSEIPKFVVNLESRPDRLESIKSEMDYIGWDYEVFNAVNRNNYMGCTLSHLGIINIAKERGYKRVMVIEDDCGFMPYANDLLNKIEESCSDLEFGVLNLAPTQNRPLNVSEKYPLLFDLTNTPDAPEECRGIYATNMMIYDESIYDRMFDISLTAFTTSGDYYFAIDDYIYNFIMKYHQSYSPILPIAPQKNNHSDVSNGMYNNWYTQTYNWNRWCPIKIPNEFLDQTKVEEMKNKKEYHNFYYVS